MFCLACDWDNVQEIPSGVSFTAGVDFIDASHPNNQGNRILIKSILRK